MANSFDILLIAIFSWTQFRITQMLLGAARRRFAGRALSGARAAIAAFNLLVVCGYILSYSDLVSRLRAPGHLSALMGAAALFYLMVATGVLMLHAVLQIRSTSAWPRTWIPTAAACCMRPAMRSTGGCPSRVLGYGYVRRTDFRVREVDVPIPNLPRDLEGFRILQLSDIHLSPFLSENDLARVVDAASGDAAPPGGGHRRPDLRPAAIRWMPASANWRASRPTPASSAAWAITSGIRRAAKITTEQAGCPRGNSLPAQRGRGRSASAIRF